MVTESNTLFQGFPGKLNFGFMGWSAVLLLKINNKLVLFDTGGPSCRRKLISTIQELGYRLTDINYLLLSHLHWDHALNYDLFPSAEIFCTKKEWESTAKDNITVYSYMLEGMKKRGGINLIDSNNSEILPGIRGILTPGHTEGSMSYLYEENGVKCCFAGDAIKNRFDIEQILIEEKDKTIKSSKYEIIKSCAKLLPGHDSWYDLISKGSISDNKVILTLPNGKEYVLSVC